MKNTFWVNGCFDLLHAGHIGLLAYAYSHGDMMRALVDAPPPKIYVGIDSDERVAKMKGANRPIFSQNERIVLLRYLKFVEKVYVFNSDEELENIIKELSPTYILVGDEYKDKRVIGKEYVEEVLFYPSMNRDVWSTTSIIKKIKSL